MDVAAADADVLVRVVEDAAQRRQVDERAALGVGPAVAAADVDHPAVGRDRDAVRLAAGGEAGLDRPAGHDAGAAVVGVDRRLAVAAHHAGRPLDGAEQVRLELLGVAVRGPAHAGEEGPPAADVAAPRDRVVGAAGRRPVTGRVGQRAPARDRVDGAGRPRLPAVPDVRAVELERQVARRGMHAVADLEGPRRRPGRARRVGARADQVVEQRRSRLALGRGADPDEAAAALHEVGERALLLAVEPVAGRVQKYDRAVAREVRSPEGRRAGSSP